MMPDKEEKRARDYLGHILGAIERIERYCRGLSEPQFLNNDLVQDAVIRNIEVIGEACRNIDKRFPGIQINYPDLPLASAYQMRNAVSHGYFSVDMEIVWRTIQKDLPQLQVQVEAILRDMGKSDTLSERGTFLS